MSDDASGEAHRPKKKVVYRPAETSSGPKTAAPARGGVRRPPPRPKAPQPRQEVLDVDFAWIRDSLKATQYVGDVLTRRDQYLNKVMALKRKFASGREREYAAHVEILLEKLRHCPMQAMLRDVLRDDSQLKKIRFF